MARTFKPGDVVKLRSGGPRMTVATIFGNGCAQCEWFKARTVQRDAYGLASLRPSPWFWPW